jgi:hypothetical protein
MILEGLAGSALGGIFRLVPEVMKIWDRKNERAHESVMMQHEITMAEKNMAHEMRKVDAAMSMAELDAMTKAITEQGETARSAGWFVAAISALVRPLVTYWFVGMYSAVKVLGMMMAVEAGGDWKEVIVTSWQADDMGMLTMVLTFWFVGRIYERQK